VLVGDVAEDSALLEVYCEMNVTKFVAANPRTIPSLVGLAKNDIRAAV
jgi:hypothetical protein